ncbi:hypothetical protein [Afipia clevelandensis]|uniref:Uncharacterized protein n=1 Tax=Afipia clevelandensis ATCC 49720 TaxID=883079 RepID=K8P5G1_9BRAD|nr:hypothetical protein [Afipia clevelandensis]EKS37792.1 hypothetical protein HMPREF9696_01742 [Afipia clevelandensis ATCC 49720]
MAKQVTHLSKIALNARGFAGHTITGTLCNRMTSYGDINCTENEAEVTCKLCLRELSYRRKRVA